MTPSNPPRLKNPKSCLTILSSLLIVILISGCGLNEEEQLYSRSIAEGKFIQICKDEYNLDVNTKFAGNTLWIYIPYQRDILTFKATDSPQMSKFAVPFVKGSLAEERFYFEYHIIPMVKPEEHKGYTTDFSEKVTEDFYHLLNVIYRVYFNAQQQPEFYVIVMADIVNGVEFMRTIYNEDLKKIFNHVITTEEYSRRILQDINGSPEIINDRIGKHLTYRQINLGQFLAEQIVQRIRFKFLSADFKLQGTIQEEILRIISYCLHTYEFRGFLMVSLKDLSTGAETTKSRLSLLEEIKEF